MKNDCEGQPIRNKQDLEEYLGGDYVECLICGAKKKSVGMHSYMAHGITADEYKAMFNIPYKRGLTCQDSHEKYREQGLERAADGRLGCSLEVTAKARSFSNRPPLPIHDAIRKETYWKTMPGQYVKNRYSAPPYYHREVYQIFLDRVASGRTIEDVGEDDDMPCSDTVWHHAKKHPELRKELTEASLLRKENSEKRL